MIERSPSKYEIHSGSADVRFEDLTDVTVKIALFWDATPCCLVDIYQRCILKMEVAGSS
jgi:hypothetical protein